MQKTQSELIEQLLDWIKKNTDMNDLPVCFCYRCDKWVEKEQWRDFEGGVCTDCLGFINSKPSDETKKKCPHYIYDGNYCYGCYQCITQDNCAHVSISSKGKHCITCGYKF